MSCKCCSTPQETKANTCPICNSKSEVVQKKTVLSLLKVGKQLPIEDQQMYYCSNSSCSLVYFSEDQNFYRKDLKVDISHKICYCFDISREEIETKGKEEILKKITDNMKDVGCSCDTRNPSGRCCISKIESEY